MPEPTEPTVFRVFGSEVWRVRRIEGTGHHHAWIAADMKGGDLFLIDEPALRRLMDAAKPAVLRLLLEDYR